MTIKGNPFGVGYSGEGKWREGQLRCTCCRFMFAGRFNADDARTGVCAECVDHAPVDGEAAERRAERAERHEVMLRQRLEALGRTAAKNREKAEDARERIGSALDSRDGYRGLLIDVAREHAETLQGCSCGARNCRTLALIEGSRYRRDIRSGAAWRDEVESDRYLRD